MAQVAFVDFTKLNTKEIEFCKASLNSEGFSVNISIGYKDNSKDSKKNVNAVLPKVKIRNLTIDKPNKPQPHEPYCYLTFHQTGDGMPISDVGLSVKQKDTIAKAQELQNHVVDLIWNNKDEILKQIKNKGQLAELKGKFESRELLASYVPDFVNYGKCNEQGVPYAPSIKAKFPFQWVEEAKDYNKFLTRKDRHLIYDCTGGATNRVAVPTTPLTLPLDLPNNTIIKPLISLGFISYAFKEKKFNIVWQVKEVLMCEKAKKYEQMEIPLDEDEVRVEMNPDQQLDPDEIMFD